MVAFDTDIQKCLTVGSCQSRVSYIQEEEIRHKGEYWNNLLSFLTSQPPHTMSQLLWHWSRRCLAAVAVFLRPYNRSFFLTGRVRTGVRVGPTSTTHVHHRLQGSCSAADCRMFWGWKITNIIYHQAVKRNCPVWHINILKDKNKTLLMSVTMQKARTTK